MDPIFCSCQLAFQCQTNVTQLQPIHVLFHQSQLSTDFRELHVTSISIFSYTCSSQFYSPQCRDSREALLFFQKHFWNFSTFSDLHPISLIAFSSLISNIFGSSWLSKCLISLLITNRAGCAQTCFAVYAEELLEFKHMVWKTKTNELKDGLHLHQC